MKMRYLAIDPGKRTGWAHFDSEGVLQGMGIIEGEDKFLDWLEDQDLEDVILERYRSRPGFINSYSDMPTSRHIGAIERICRKKKATIHHQDPSPCLSIGLRFLGMYALYFDAKTQKLKHVPDNISALAHGTYYLRQKKVLTG